MRCSCTAAVPSLNFIFEKHLTVCNLGAKQCTSSCKPSNANKRNFYLCAFALKKCFLSFLALEKSKRNSTLYEKCPAAVHFERTGQDLQRSGGWQKIYTGSENSNNS